LSVEQHYDYNGIDVTYLDFSEQVHSIPCQPRDIHILFPMELNVNSVKEEIAVDIRTGQGYGWLGVRKNLKFEFD